MSARWQPGSSCPSAATLAARPLRLPPWLARALMGGPPLFDARATFPPSPLFHVVLDTTVGPDVVLRPLPAAVHVLPRLPVLPFTVAYIPFFPDAPFPHVPTPQFQPSFHGPVGCPLSERPLSGAFHRSFHQSFHRPLSGAPPVWGAPCLSAPRPPAHRPTSPPSAAAYPLSPSFLDHRTIVPLLSPAAQAAFPRLRQPANKAKQQREGLGSALLAVA